jgi:hypothetical protein
MIPVRRRAPVASNRRDTRRGGEEVLCTLVEQKGGGARERGNRRRLAPFKWSGGRGFGGLGVRPVEDATQQKEGRGGVIAQLVGGRLLHGAGRGERVAMDIPCGRHRCIWTGVSGADRWAPAIVPGCTGQTPLDRFKFE